MATALIVANIWNFKTMIALEEESMYAIDASIFVEYLTILISIMTEVDNMNNEKYYELHINGCCCSPEPMTEDELMDAFLEMCESKNWTFGGSLVAEKVTN